MYINCLAVIFVCYLHDMEKIFFPSKCFKLLGAAFLLEWSQGCTFRDIFSICFFEAGKAHNLDRKEVWKYPYLNWYVFEPF